MIIQTERTLFKKEENADAVKAADSLIAKAAASGASDIHIEPGENNACVRMRIDGVLYKEAEKRGSRGCFRHRSCGAGRVRERRNRRSSGG